MIVVDTNVISEMMRLDPDKSVVAWFRSVKPPDLFTTTITIAEILAGIRFLPRGQRRSGMEVDARSMFTEDFGGRVLAFDLSATEHYAELCAERRSLGRPVRPLDGQIAAIARANNMSVATRSIPDFEACGVDLINPWDA